jgi:hypothetical protein
MRGDESLAYDLTVRVGRVRGRVALLLRSTERKPLARLDFSGCVLSGAFSPHQKVAGAIFWRGVGERGGKDRGENGGKG